MAARAGRQIPPTSVGPPAPANLGNEQRYTFVLRWYRNELPESFVKARLAIATAFVKIASQLHVTLRRYSSTTDDSDVLEEYFEVHGHNGYLLNFNHAIRTITETMTRNPDWRRSDARSTRKIVGQPIAGIIRGSKARDARRDSKTVSVWELTAARLRPGKNGKYVSEHVFYSHDREEMRKAAWELKEHVYKQMHKRWRFWGHKDTLSIGVNEYPKEADRKGFFVRLEHASSLALLEAIGYALAYMSRPRKTGQWQGNLDAFDRYVIRYNRKGLSEVGSTSRGLSRSSINDVYPEDRYNRGNQRNRSQSPRKEDDQQGNRYVQGYEKERRYQHGRSGKRGDAFSQSGKPLIGLFGFRSQEDKERRSLQAEQEKRLRRASARDQGDTSRGRLASMMDHLPFKKRPQPLGRRWEESRKPRPKWNRVFRSLKPAGAVEQASTYYYSDYTLSQA